MPFIPAHEANAIDRVSATVVFQEPVRSEAWIQIFIKAAEVGRERALTLPVEMLAASLTFPSVQPGFLPTATTQILATGIGFKKVTDEGAPLIDFMIHRNEIKVDHHAYVRWPGFRDSTLSLMRPLLEAFPPDWPVAQVRLSYWDRFINHEGTTSWGEVVRSDGRLPPWVVDAKTHWHSYVGWIERSSAADFLINLNAETVDEIDESGRTAKVVRLNTLVTTIGPQAPAGTIGQSLSNKLDELHTLSKKAVSEALSAQMADRITLFPEEQS